MKYFLNTFGIYNTHELYGREDLQQWNAVQKATCRELNRYNMHLKCNYFSTIQ